MNSLPQKHDGIPGEDYLVSYNLPREVSHDFTNRLREQSRQDWDCFKSVASSDPASRSKRL